MPEDRDDGPSELTEDQKKSILLEWNSRPDDPPDLKELCVLCFGGEFDGRSRRAKLIKAFLAERGSRARAAQEYKRVDVVELSPEQREFIERHAMTPPLELTKELFNNPKLTPLSKETREVLKYLDTVDPRRKTNEPDKEIDVDYKPPTSLRAAAKKVNQYILNAILFDKIEKDNALQENLRSLVKFLHSNRFKMIIDSYMDNRDKKLFESLFIKYTWDKPDLTEEEIDQYVNLCVDIVTHHQLQDELANLRTYRDADLESSDGKRLMMSMVEQISNIYRQINENLKRQDKWIENLTGKRKDRIDTRIKQNASAIQLVEAWRDEEKRKKLIQFANIRKKAVKKEQEKFETIDSFKAEIFGLNERAFILEGDTE